MVETDVPTFTIQFCTEARLIYTETVIFLLPVRKMPWSGEMRGAAVRWRRQGATVSFVFTVSAVGQR